MDLMTALLYICSHQRPERSLVAATETHLSGYTPIYNKKMFNFKTIKTTTTIFSFKKIPTYKHHIQEVQFKRSLSSL